MAESFLTRAKQKLIELRDAAQKMFTNTTVATVMGTTAALLPIGATSVQADPIPPTSFKLFDWQLTETGVQGSGAIDPAQLGGNSTSGFIDGYVIGLNYDSPPSSPNLLDSFGALPDLLPAAQNSFTRNDFLYVSLDGDGKENSAGFDANGNPISTDIRIFLNLSNPVAVTFNQLVCFYYPGAGKDQFDTYINGTKADSVVIGSTAPGCTLSSFATTLPSGTVQIDRVTSPVQEDNIPFNAFSVSYNQWNAYVDAVLPAEVPEPVTLTLLGTGIAGLAYLRYRRPETAGNDNTPGTIDDAKRTPAFREAVPVITTPDVKDRLVAIDARTPDRPVLVIQPPQNENAPRVAA